MKIIPHKWKYWGSLNKNSIYCHLSSRTGSEVLPSFRMTCNATEEFSNVCITSCILILWKQLCIMSFTVCVFVTFVFIGCMIPSLVCFTRPFMFCKLCYYIFCKYFLGLTDLPWSGILLCPLCKNIFKRLFPKQSHIFVQASFTWFTTFFANYQTLGRTVFTVSKMSIPVIKFGYKIPI